MKISKHFNLEEFERTSHNVSNKADIQSIINICALTHNVLEVVRLKLKHPININSGFRSSALNKLVKGDPTSQHTRGQAVDITCVDNLLLFHLLFFHTDFDQLIWYDNGTKAPSFIHVSFNLMGNRNQVLRAVKNNNKTNYKTFYL